MNVVQSFIDRQVGLSCSGNYDVALRRLCVAREDSFYGLSNAAGGALDQDPPMFACRFAEHSARPYLLALANEDGRVALQDTSVVRADTTLEGFQCHNNAVFDLAWRPAHLSFVTVSGDHTASLWDLESGTPRRALLCCSHTRSVKTVAFAREQPAVFASGARDGRVLLWDLRAAPAPSAALPPSPDAPLLRPDNCLLNCHAAFAPKTPGSRRRPERRAPSITGLVFRDQQTLVSCGECDGNIKVWDLRKNYNVYKREPLPKHSIPYCGSSTKNGYTNLIIDEASRRLYASCMDNVIYCFDVSTYGALPERRYIGHENGTFYIKAGLSPDGRYLVSGSSDKRAYVWDVRRSQPVVRLAGHAAEVTCAAWAPAGPPTLVTCSDDARHKIWRVGPESPPRPEAGAQAGGRAEPAPPAEFASWPRRAPVTPTSLKRKRGGAGAGAGAGAGTPGSGGAGRAGGPRAPCKSKRCLADMLGAPREADEGGRPERTTPPKRSRLDSEPQSAKDFTYFSPRPGPSCASPTESERTAQTPTPLQASPGSPKVRIVPIGTPTKDLPNFVLNGEAPHHRLMSPVKRRVRARGGADWLTQLRAARPAPPPAPAPAAARPAPAPAPAPAPPPPAAADQARPKGPKLGPKTSTLLKYFNVASKNK